MEYMDLLLTISTFLLMVFTGFYVFFTYRLQKETKRSVDEINRPEVVVTLGVNKTRPNNEGPIIYELCLGVMNAGTRPARNIRLYCDESFIPAGSGFPLITSKYFKNGIDILMVPKRQMDVLLSTEDISKIFDDEYYKRMPSKIQVTVKYQSANETEYEDVWTLDFNNPDDHRL